MKHLITFISMFVFSTLVLTAQDDAVRIKQFNIEKGLAVKGYDVVSYFSGKAMKGKSSFAYTYKSVTYYFSSQLNLDTFKKNPAGYEPAYGGWCAYAMGATGEKVEVDPETFKILNGKLYLFYNFYFNNTLSDWNKDEVNLKKKADLKWAAFLTK